MAKRPEHRYASAGDISRDLTEAVGAFRYSHERPSRAITDPTIPPAAAAAAGYGGSPEVVPVPASPAPRSRPPPRRVMPGAAVRCRRGRRAVVRRCS